mgnify:CR=1 FL=1
MKSLSNWQILHVQVSVIPVEQEENEDLLMLLMPMMLND